MDDLTTPSKKLIFYIIELVKKMGFQLKDIIKQYFKFIKLSEIKHLMKVTKIPSKLLKEYLAEVCEI